jgi:hypothetical protein
LGGAALTTALFELLAMWSSPLAESWVVRSNRFRSESYDFRIYNNNASVVVDYIVFFKVEETIFVALNGTPR